MPAFSEQLDYLYSLRTFGVKPGLARVRRLLAAVGQPQQAVPYIHIAGTNGKGSTAAMLAAILQAAGLRVGLFTSPHLASFCERIQINGTPVAESDCGAVLAHVRAVAEADISAGEDHATFFEIVTVAAALHFHNAKCQVVVWETGLGGRLDATNAVESVVASVITPIALDHMQWLGPTIESIAVEKAGIIRPGRPVFTNVPDPAALRVICARCAELQAPLTYVAESARPASEIDKKALQYHYISKGQAAFGLSMPALGIADCAIGLRGKHQVANAALASAVAHWYLQVKSIAGGSQHITTGLRNASWPGRIQVLRDQPLVVLDCAHNPHGCAALIEALREMHTGRWIVAFGALADKNAAEMLAMLNQIADELWYVPPSNARALSCADVNGLCKDNLPGIHISKNFASAPALVHHIAQTLNDPRPMVIAGSCYLAGDMLTTWHGQPRDARGDDPVRLNSP